MDKIIAFIDAITSGLQRLKGWASDSARLRALFDQSAWLMIAPSVGCLYYFDPAMATTLLQWSAYALSLAGAAVVISRLVFPQIDLGELVGKVREEDSLPAAVIISAVVLFVSAITLCLVLWGKA